MSCREEGDGPEALLWAVALFGGCRPEGEAGSLPVSEHCIRFKPRETHAEADVRGGLSLRDLFTDCFCRRIERGTLGSVGRDGERYAVTSDGTEAVGNRTTGRFPRGGGGGR